MSGNNLEMLTNPVQFDSVEKRQDHQCTPPKKFDSQRIDELRKRRYSVSDDSSRLYVR